MSGNFSTPLNSSNTSRGVGWYKTPVDDVATALSAAILAPMLVFGVFANILTMVVILRTPKLKSAFNTIIVSLCFSDLASSLLSILYVYRRTWAVDNWAAALPEFLCKISWGGDIATSIATSLHIVTFAFLRFFSLKWPYSFKAVQTSHATIAILIIWLLAMGCGFVPMALWSVVKPISFAQHLRSDKSKTWAICSLGRPWYRQFKNYTLSGYVIFFYIPLILVCLFSVGVGTVFCSRRLKKMKHASSNNMMTSNQIAVEAARKRKENQALLQLALIVGSFMLGYLPQSVVTGGIHLRGLAPGQHNSEKTSQRWRAVGDAASDLTDPRIQPQTSRTDSNVYCADLPVLRAYVLPQSSVYCVAFLGLANLPVYYIYVAVRGPPNRNNLVFGWWFSMIAYMLLRLSECLNPIFYNLGSSQIRAETMTYFRGMCCRHSASSGELPKPTQLTAITKAPSIKKINQI